MLRRVAAKSRRITREIVLARETGADKNGAYLSAIVRDTALRRQEGVTSSPHAAPAKCGNGRQQRRFPDFATLHPG